jgi:threonine/homoserine/homoserine lactone efflux protein
MFEVQTIAVFLSASLVLLVMPGPAVIFIVATSLRDGRAGGMVSMLGIACGGLVHVAAAVVGLSALLTSSPAAYRLVKFLGAAYLIYLGFRAWREARPRQSTGELPPRQPFSQTFRQGFIVNALNPKPALFFMAFLPQFADPAAGNIHLQFLLLALMFEGLGILTDTTYALTAGTLRNWLLRRSGTASAAGGRIAAVIYCVLGIWALASSLAPGN